MFCWILMLRKLFNKPSSNHLYSNHPSFGIQSKRPQARRRKPATKLELQVLEDRTLLSVAVVETPSLVAAMEQQAVHAIVTLQNAFSGIVTTAVQEVAQEEASIAREEAQLMQEWANLFKDIFGPQNAHSIPPTPSAGSGSGSGAATTAHNATNQQPNANLQQSGNGSGSGAATTAHEGTPTKGIVKPMVSGTGFGSASPAGSGVGSGSLIVYTWDPQGYGSGTGHGGGSGNDLASNFHNWLIDGQKQNGTTGTVPDDSRDEALFNGSVSDAPIEWDDPQFEIMKLVNKYNNVQTIDDGVTVELLGTKGASLTMDGTSWLNLNFKGTSTFQIDNNATITNMNIVGNFFSNMIINGGTTTMAGNPGAGNPVFTEKLGVNLKIDTGATLVDLNYNPIQLTANNLIITVKGNMYMYYGSTPTNTIIDGGVANPNDFIDVDGGLLGYYGSQNVADILTVPIEVEGGGRFVVGIGEDSPQPYSGTLFVDGDNGFTNDVSVYMTGASSSVELINGDTLRCSFGYRQDSGTLATMEQTLDILQAGAAGSGTVTINGGYVEINQPSTSITYGRLNVMAKTLTFNGKLVVAIDASNKANKDYLYVSGTTNLQNNSTLYVFVNNSNQLQKKLSWVIIEDNTGPINKFVMPMATNPALNLSDGVNATNNEQYVVTS